MSETATDARRTESNKKNRHLAMKKSKRIVVGMKDRPNM